MAFTLRAMPTRVYAPCTCTSMGMVRMSMRLTCSMSGRRQARPPKITRYPLSLPSGLRCLRPEKMRILVGPADEEEAGDDNHEDDERKAATQARDQRCAEAR